MSIASNLRQKYLFLDHSKEQLGAGLKYILGGPLHSIQVESQLYMTCWQLATLQAQDFIYITSNINNFYVQHSWIKLMAGIGPSIAVALCRPQSDAAT